MLYKNKIYILGGISAALALIYILTFVFDPQRRNTRGAAYTWLSPRSVNEVAGITIRLNDGNTSEGNVTEVKLEKTAAGADGADAASGGKSGNAAWFVVNDGRNFPAKESWVDELLTALSKKGAYPIRSRTDSAHEKLGLAEAKAKRIVLTSAGGQTLLDLLIGNTDTTGKRYMRKNGSSETRSGDDSLRGWGGYLPNYYDLRLFPDHDKKKLSVADVQRVIITPLPPAPDTPDAPEGAAAPSAAQSFAPWTLARSGSAWQVEASPSSEDAKLDTVQVENYVRGILDAAADNFILSMNAADEPFITAGSGPVPGRLIIQTGDGKEHQITLAAEKVNEK
ncbi:MAG: DUF4340 domain-containing protein, partial [Spirochaetaceae bacterium]|nr:DUF4340 domain-containing protein [Spirochaetaceae bacterium]